VKELNKKSAGKGDSGKIRKPIYAREEMSRLVKWFFGLPLIYVAWVVVSLVMPSFSTGYRMELVLNIMSYCIFILIALAVIKYFLNFPIAKLFGESGHLDFKGLFVGFGAMLVSGLALTLIHKWLNPEQFSFTFSTSGWVLDWLLSLILVIVAALLEELLMRAYIAYFVKDKMETRPRWILVYCLASGVLFAIAHFSNPEVAGSGAYFAMGFYFMMGFVLMLITLRTHSIGAALGIHIANNLINAWFFTYSNAVVKTNALFTQTDNSGPLLLVDAAICLLACVFSVRAYKRALEH
jgi:membrane protease YdiL (CAAX protease family)